MTINKIINRLMAHFAPLSLLKAIHPVQVQSSNFSPMLNENQPWMNVDLDQFSLEENA